MKSFAKLVEGMENKMNTPMKYRKKSSVVKAMRWDGKSRSVANQIIQWINATNWQTAAWNNEHSTNSGFPDESWVPEGIYIQTPRGKKVHVSSGDWVIQEESGEFHTYDDELFTKTYERWNFTTHADLIKELHHDGEWPPYTTLQNLLNRAADAIAQSDHDLAEARRRSFVYVTDDHEECEIEANELRRKLTAQAGAIEVMRQWDRETR